jgi:hypothetical protein
MTDSKKDRNGSLDLCGLSRKGNRTGADHEDEHDWAILTCPSLRRFLNCLSGYCSKL